MTTHTTNTTTTTNTATLLPNYPSRRTIVLSGASAGVIGGVVMGFMAMIISAAMGQGFWTPLYLIAGVFWGVSTLVAGPGAAFTGFIVHALVAAFIGGVFGSLIQRRRALDSALVGGLAYGFLVWGFMNYLVLPWANPTMYDRVNLTPGWWFIEHLVYGGTLGLAPIIAKRYTVQRRRPVQHRETRTSRAA